MTKTYSTTHKLFCTVIMILLCLTFGLSNVYAKFDASYFRNPLDIPIVLAGNFGELRPNHFHTGLDIKTNQKENLPVYAAAEGYITRINISHSGYGNCLHIAHPNGYTTVYAHLNDFSPEIEKYIKQVQYEKESWAVDVKVPQEALPVKKGQQIAWSGNTGGSVAPHLHFEIRNTLTEKVINPMYWGFTYNDDIAPLFKSVALYEENSPYLQTPITFTTHKKDGTYSINNGIIKVPMQHLRIGYDAIDQMNGSTNSLGIYQSKLLVNGIELLTITMDTIDFSTNKAINAFADYKSEKLSNTWFIQLFKLKNNPLDLYQFNKEAAEYIDLSDGQVKNITIKISDYQGNTSTLQMSVQYEASISRVPFVCNGPIYDAEKINSFSSSTSKVEFNEKAFYDDVCFITHEDKDAQGWSTNLTLGQNFIPLASVQELNMKLLKPVPFALRQKLIFKHYIANANLPGAQAQSAMPAKYSYGYASAFIRTLGKYSVSIDTIAPEIKNLKINNKGFNEPFITFDVLENQTSISKVDMYIDNQWIRCIRKGNKFTYFKDEKCPQTPKNIKIVALDQNNNQKTLERTIF